MRQENGWDSFVQSRSVRLVMNGMCAVICGCYAVDALVELLTPGSAAPFLATVGETGYYVITIARLVVCVWVAVVFARNTAATFREPKDGAATDDSERRS